MSDQGHNIVTPRIAPAAATAITIFITIIQYELRRPSISMLLSHRLLNKAEQRGFCDIVFLNMQKGSHMTTGA
jgi:hypothetical protein